MAQPNDSIYKSDKDLVVKPESEAPVKISLSGPLSFWIGIIIITALIQLIVAPFYVSYGSPLLNSYLNSFANYVLYIPGIIVLPLIAAVWIGDHVSSSIGNRKRLLVSKGILNALYSILVYAIAVYIIYSVMQHLGNSTLAHLSTLSFIEYVIAVPSAILIVVVPLFAILSAARD